MDVVRYIIKECCGSTASVIKLDRPLSIDIFDYLKLSGFEESPHFTKCGIVYVENDGIIITAPFGSNNVTVKCKSKNCQEYLEALEKILKLYN